MAWKNWYLNFQHQHFWSSKSLPSFSILIRLCDNKCAPCDKIVVNIFPMSTWVNLSWDPENRKTPSMRDNPPLHYPPCNRRDLCGHFPQRNELPRRVLGLEELCNLHFYPTNGLYLILSGANCIYRIHEKCTRIHQDLIKHVHFPPHTSMLQSKMTTSWWRKHLGAVIYIFLLLLEE